MMLSYYIYYTCIYIHCTLQRWTGIDSLPVLDITHEAKGQDLKCGLNDKNTCKEVVENLQCKLQLLKIKITGNKFCYVK